MKHSFGVGTIPCLLAADLDGTLAFGGVISPEFRTAARRVRAEGIPLLLVTGRNPRSLERVEGVWTVADEILFSSGAGILRGPEAVPEERGRLCAEDVGLITEILDRHGEDYCILNPIPDNHYFAWRRNRSAAENPDFDARRNFYRDWERPYDGQAVDACQILVILPPGKTSEETTASLGVELSSWSTFRSASPLDHASIWLEVFPFGVNKGRALADWCAEYDVGSDRVVALGNDFNDVSMLDWAGRGRVVPNAPAMLRETYVIRSFPEAVDEVLELFGY